MPNLYEVVTDWAFENSPGGNTVMYFTEGSADISFLRASLETMYESVADRLDSLTRYTIRTSGNVKDSATGLLTDAWADGEARTGLGTAVGEPVPNASQVLLQWRTEAIVSGRRLRGRTFIPGLTSLAVVSGHLGSTALADFTDAAEQFVEDCAGQFVVWHRPVGGAGGSVAPVTTASVWNELAVQRGRR